MLNMEIDGKIQAEKGEGSVRDEIESDLQYDVNMLSYLTVHEFKLKVHFSYYKIDLFMYFSFLFIIIIFCGFLYVLHVVCEAVNEWVLDVKTLYKYAEKRTRNSYKIFLQGYPDIVYINK